MPVPVISVADMRQWEEASWDAGCSQAEVISRVGQVVASRACSLTRDHDTVLILAGKGHNGDDARCARFHMPRREVQILNISNPAASLPELDAALEKSPALIIDGLFGIGLNRPLDGAWIEIIERVNKSYLPLLAIDVPSGLDAESGEPMVEALYASVTLTIGAPKIGLLRHHAAHFVGRLEVATDIGLAPGPTSGELMWGLSSDFKNFPPARRDDGHKGSFGHAVIMAGSHGYHGAAVLASNGALRAMPGLVTVLCPGDVYLPVASQSQAAMVHEWQPGRELPENCSSLLIGPGLAAPSLDAAWRNFANEQWQTFPMPVVIDASALGWIEPGPTPLNSRRIITPHPGEAARMLGVKPSDVQENRPAALRQLSARFGNCWVVLKGRQTLIGRSTGEIFVNPSGNPYLAQGGAGDLLAGYLAGLLAQPRLQAQPLKTIRYAVWQHGAAADALAARHPAWTIEQLKESLGTIRPGEAVNPGSVPSSL